MFWTFAAINESSVLFTSWRVVGALFRGIAFCFGQHVDALIALVRTHLTQEEPVGLLRSEDFPKIAHQSAGERVYIRVAYPETVVGETSVEGLQ